MGTGSTTSPDPVKERRLTQQEHDATPAPRRRFPRRRGAAAVLAAVVIAAAALRFLPTLAGDGGDQAGRPVVGVEVPVTAMEASVQPANNSPTIVADPTNPSLVVIANRLDAPGFSCALQLSRDGGRSWVTANPGLTLPAGTERCYAPEAAFDARGVLYYSFVGLRGAGNEPVGVFLITSSDQGRTWTTPREVLGPRNFGVRMAIDPTHGKRGRIHLVWLHATSDPPLGGFGPSPNPILAAHSDDGGKTFSAPVQVSDPDRPLAVAPSLALGSDGRVHVAYYDLQDDTRDYLGLEGPVWEGRWSVLVATSTDGGRRFGRGVVVDDAVAPWARPMLIYTLASPALVADDQRVCAAWTDARHGDADVLASCSRSEGRKFAPARRLNDDPVGNGRSQYLPQLGISPEGRLDAIFYDRRRDPANTRADVFYTFSTEAGGPMAPNQRLTSEASDTRVGQQYTNVSAEGQFEVGSRLGLLSRREAALAAWADARNSSVGSTAQELFATTVAHRPRQSRPGAVAGVEVTVTMREQAFDYDGPIPAGRVVFRVDNAGTDEHRLDLFPLGDDVPPIAEQLAGAERRRINPLANIATRRPGESGTFAVDLVAGRRYAFVCFVRDDDGRTHAVKGMSSEFRAQARGPGR